MSKPLKDLMTDSLRRRYDGVAEACVVDITGMSVDSVTGFRTELRQRKLNLLVVKNSMARRAFAGSSLEVLSDRLKGPSALVTGEASGVEMAKLLVDLARKFKPLSLRDGLLEGETDVFPVESLAKMKSRVELIADVLGLTASPGRKVAGCLSSPQAKIAGCLKTLSEKGEAA